jgi:sirohydrochlorin ferrochelatase
MRALLIIAHGSRREASNEEIHTLANKLSLRLNEKYAHVGAGFLEMAEPDIGTSLQNCVLKGATSIDVMPYFLAAGRHVVTDVPADVNTFAELHPTVEINVLPYIGGTDGMVDLLVDVCGG